MKNRILALLLILAMALSLAACGGNNGQNNQNDSQNNQEDQMDQPDGGNSDADGTEDPDQGEMPEIPEEGETDPQDPGDQEQNGNAEESKPEEAKITASHSDVTFRSVGSSFKLTAKGASGTDTVTYASADEAIATVAEDGTVTAVAPGTTKVTMTVESEGGKQEFTCVIRCSWKEEAPEEQPEEKPEEKPVSNSVDLQAFYDEMTSQYEFGFLSAFEGEILENYYPGMGAVPTEQCLVMGTMMTMNNGEFCLVEVSDGKEAEKNVEIVKAIFRDRIDTMVNGGAWYPGPTEQWTNNSRVVSNGNYVMMVVHENCDDIVDAFNALFK